MKKTASDMDPRMSERILEDRWRPCFASADAVVLSDYGKGMFNSSNRLFRPLSDPAGK
jgi:bifunctional ADP-heptose synthase (sugar kinase/adenylyltransferase)